MRYIIALALVLTITGCADEEPTEPQFKYRIVIDKVEAGTRERGNPPETVDTWEITLRTLNRLNEIEATGSGFRCLWENNVPKDSPSFSQSIVDEYPNGTGGSAIDERSSAGLYVVRCTRENELGELKSIISINKDVEPATIPQ